MEENKEVARKSLILNLNKLMNKERIYEETLFHSESHFDDDLDITGTYTSETQVLNLNKHDSNCYDLEEIKINSEEGLNKKPFAEDVLNEQSFGYGLVSKENTSVPLHLNTHEIQQHNVYETSLNIDVMKNCQIVNVQNSSLRNDDQEHINEVSEVLRDGVCEENYPQSQTYVVVNAKRIWIEEDDLIQYNVDPPNLNNCDEVISNLKDYKDLQEDENYSLLTDPPDDVHNQNSESERDDKIFLEETEQVCDSEGEIDDTGNCRETQNYEDDEMEDDEGKYYKGHNNCYQSDSDLIHVAEEEELWEDKSTDKEIVFHYSDNVELVVEEDKIKRYYQMLNEETTDNKHIILEEKSNEIQNLAAEKTDNDVTYQINMANEVLEKNEEYQTKIEENKSKEHLEGNDKELEYQSSKIVEYEDNEVLEDVFYTVDDISSISRETGPPEPPAGRPSVAPSDTSVSVAWSSPPYDGGCVLTGYRVEMKTDTDKEWNVVAERCHSLSRVIRGLTTGQIYTFRVRAENIHGASEPSSESVPIQLGFIEPEEEEEMPSQLEPCHVEVQPGDEFLSRYTVHEELGKGRYGVVHKVTDQKTGNTMAAKFVRCIKKQDREKVQEEIDIMNCLRHPKLLQLVAAFENPKDIVMIMEYISGGELFERVVADDFTLTEKDCIIFMRQICEGVDYMHNNLVVHLDLKPENIMCRTRTSHQIKLIDFGLAQKLNPDSPVRVLFGTPEFIPPEIINYEPIGVESDMWSVGVICYVLLSGLSPFMGDNDAETFANITRADYDFDDEAFDAISQDAKDFISSLLEKRRDKRLTAVQCLQHKWMTQCDTSMSCVKLCTDKLKKFIIRRKWQPRYERQTA